MKNNVQLETAQSRPRATTTSGQLLPLQSAPVSRRVVNSAVSSDMGLEASDWNDDNMPVNYFVHVQ